ncbi:MAG: LPS export ABC transporter periplasmic protein LptC [Thermodesulfobacteriota bacterium]
MTGLRILVLSLIFLVAGATIFTIQFSNRGEGESPLPVETDADCTLKDIHFVGDKSGMKEWELEAKEARHFQEGKMTMLEDIEAAFYIKEGGVIRLKGDRGRILHGTRDIELQGNIVIFTTDGSQLTTDNLHYVDKTKQIRSSRRVDIGGKGLEITGRDMCIDLVTGKLTMRGRVDSVLFDALGGWKDVVPRWDL